MCKRQIQVYTVQLYWVKSKELDPSELYLVEKSETKRRWLKGWGWKVQNIYENEEKLPLIYESYLK